MSTCYTFTVLFVIKNKNISLIKNINKKIINNFGKFCLPKDIIILKQLPKTKSGKILRRLLRLIYLNKDINKIDTSTIADKKILNEISLSLGNLK